MDGRSPRIHVRHAQHRDRRGGDDRALADVRHAVEFNAPNRRRTQSGTRRRLPWQNHTLLIGIGLLGTFTGYYLGRAPV
jgi:hypothetical protein